VHLLVHHRPGTGTKAVAQLLLCLAIFAQSPQVGAATLRVGPNEAITTIAEAARRARDGDLVEIMPGTYRGDVAVWPQRWLTIRGIGTRPVLEAAGKNAEGKAIWVIRNGDFRIENLEFRGARVADGNGAGIRFEKGRLEVTSCGFYDNENGILTANFGDAELFIKDSEFAHAPRVDHPLKHLLYVGRISRLSVHGSRFHDGYVAHLIKSRARVTELRYNLIYDGPHGSASYEVDLPNAGDALLVGNIIGQSAKTSNPVVVSYGAEGNSWPVNRLRMAHNTLINDGWLPAKFAHVWKDRVRPPVVVETRNNLTLGLGLFDLDLPGSNDGNVSVPKPALLHGEAILDFSLRGGATLSAVVKEIDNTELRPNAEFTLPIGTTALTPPRHWLPGAIQSADMPHQPR
jgi:hypothetical protein